MADKVRSKYFFTQNCATI